MNWLIAATAQYLIFLIILIAILVTWFSERQIRRRIILLGVFSLILALVIAQFTGIFIYNARPFVVDNMTPLFPHAADNGFPSDHALIALVISLAVMIYRWKWGLLMVILGILVGAARVFSGVHHWVDIGGSTGIAMVSVFLAWIILLRVENSFWNFFNNKIAARARHKNHPAEKDQ